MFECISRTPTPEEAAKWPNERITRAVNFGCATIIFGLVPWFILWRVFRKIAIDQGHPDTWVPAAVAGAVAIGLCVWALRGMSVNEGRRKARFAEAGQDGSLIEEWRIEASRVVQLIPFGEDEPVLCFEVESDRIVMLKGQWLWDESTYGAPRIKDDPDENFLNGLGKPYSFPSRKFTVVRWPGTGKVVNICVSGDYLAPEKSNVEIKRYYYFNASKQIEGRLDDLQPALEREAAKHMPS